jgi:hypothetical protein
MARPRFERTGEFAPAAEVASRLQRWPALTIFFKSHGRDPLCIGCRALCHCRLCEASRRRQVPFPQMLGVGELHPYVRLQKVRVVQLQSDINNFSTNIVSTTHPAHPSALTAGVAKRGRPEAERTPSEGAMTKLVASPRRELLCPVRQFCSPGCAADILYQTALCAIIFAVSRPEAAAECSVVSSAAEGVR